MPAIKNILIVLLCVLLYKNGHSQSADQKSNTQIADSLDAQGEYKESLKFRSLALEESNHSLNFKKRIQAKWYYTQACSFEIIGGQENHKKALELSIKARNIINEITDPCIGLKIQIANRIYHLSGYTQQWRRALVEAQENLRIIRDTFPDEHHRVLLILDDLGFINGRLGDYVNSLKYYDKVEKLYRTHYPDNKKDLAMNYSRMAINYKKLGMRKKEFKALALNEKLWRETNVDLNSPLFNIYGNFSAWYTDYGNYSLAESYLSKQAKLIDSIKHKAAEFESMRRAEYLALYNNYITLNFKQEDYGDVKKYLALFEKELEASNRSFIEDVKYEADLYLFKSQLPEKASEESVALIKKAIDLTKLFKDKFALDPTEYQIKLFKKYDELEYHKDAELLLREIIEGYSKDNDHELFYLYINYANQLSKNGKNELAESHIRKALKIYLKDESKNSDLAKINIGQLKPYYSFESIEGFLVSSRFYFDRFKLVNNSNDLKIAYNLGLLAADIFNNLYLGDRYNDNLYDTYKAIEHVLLESLIYNSSTKNITKTLETIENNKSKLTWSKFMYSQVKQTINVPDSITDKEYDLKTLINYYQNTLYSKQSNFKLESDTLISRIADLKLELSKIQEDIKKNYTNYYNRNYNVFDLSEFRKTLSNEDLIIKYIISKGNLYSFSVSKSNIELNRQDFSDQTRNEILDYIEQLSIFNSDYNRNLDKIKPLFLSLLDKKKHKNITIIPEDVLNYLPFETLLVNYSSLKSFKNHAIGYATSLLMLSEQNRMKFSDKDLKLGVFSSAYNAMNELPSVSRETTDILNVFEGNLFNKASKNEFLDHAKNFDVLHLAMHAKIDNSNPEFSSLAFNEEHLLMTEMYNEVFKAKLAVLSACETGSGALLKGEGIQSISRAFTYTGIPSAVVSLWKVDDEATAKIMGAFYRHLKDGNTKDIALRNAKLDYLNNTDESALKHPYYWAGFIVSGNTQPLIKNSKKPWYLGVASVSLLLLVLFRRKLQLF